MVQNEEEDQNKREKKLVQKEQEDQNKREKNLVQNEEEDQNKREKNLVQNEEENQKDSVPEEKKEAAPKVSGLTLTAPNTVKQAQEISIVQKTKGKKQKLISAQLKDLKKARQEYSRTKGKEEKQQLTAILQNVSKAIQTFQVEEKPSWDGIPYPKVTKRN